MIEKFQGNIGENTGDRNAFENYFKSPNEFASVLFNKIRAGEINLEKIKNNPLRFVSQLIGRDKADRLTPGEIDVFVKEAERVILEKEKIRRGAVENLEKQAISAGFVDGGYYDKDGNKVLRGDIEAYQRHINGEMDDEDE